VGILLGSSGCRPSRVVSRVLCSVVNTTKFGSADLSIQITSVKGSRDYLSKREGFTTWGGEGIYTRSESTHTLMLMTFQGHFILTIMTLEGHYPLSELVQQG
jgi:hypothetical protein